MAANKLASNKLATNQLVSNTVFDRSSIVAARQGLVPEQSGGWAGGFGNMLGKELGEWFGGRRWMVHSLVWLLIINGFIAFILFAVPILDPNSNEASGNIPLDMLGMSLYFAFAVNSGTMGMIISAQDKVIREKQSGTAAWILSKPVGRPAFILSKLLSSLAGGMVFIAVIPAAVALIESYLASGRLAPILPVMAGVGVVGLALVFYLTLTLMLGALFEERGPILGAAFGIMFGGMILANFLPPLAYVFPTSLHDIATAIAQGQALPGMAISQMISTAALSVLFTVVALWRFQREEF